MAQAVLLVARATFFNRAVTNICDAYPKTKPGLPPDTGKCNISRRTWLYSRNLTPASARGEPPNAIDH